MRSLFGRGTGRVLTLAIPLAALAVAIPVFANLPGSDFDAGDGNLVLNDEAKDWVNAPNFGKRIDLLKGQGDDAFGEGTSEDQPVPNLKTDGIPPNKSDITRFYVGSETVTGPPLKNFLYLAWERITDPAGTTNFDFELNQSTDISANGRTPVRTADDVLIKYDLANGGTTPVLGYHIWVTADTATAAANATCEASSKFPCWDKVHVIDDEDFEAAINTATEDDPIDPSGGPNPADPNDPSVRKLSPRTFGEAAIDLVGAGILDPGDCEGFASAYLKSRSSDSFNSAIKDFAAPVPANINNCGALSVHKYIDINEDGNEDAGEAAITPLGGVIAGDLTGWNVTIAGPGSFSCTGSTNAAGLLTSCLKADNTAADLTGLAPGTYTVTETANAGKLIGSSTPKSPFLNTDPGPATPPSSEQATVGLGATTTVDLGNSCYTTANFEVTSVPTGQSGLFVEYTVDGGAAQRVNLAQVGSTSNYTASVDSLRRGDVIVWSYGINRDTANEQTKAVPGSFTLNGYPTCSGSSSVVFATATVNGSKFKDVNGNGIRNLSPTPSLNDGPLQGFEFELRRGSTGSGSVVGTAQRSAGNGTFAFQDVAAGTYTIHEINRPSGWLQTQPASNGHVSVTVTLGDTSVTADPFGNTPLSKVQVNFLPQAKLLNLNGTESSTSATKATSISCTDPTAGSVGSSTNSNTLTTDDVQIKQSSVTCVITYEDP